jgi:hypothetical protein
MRQRGMPARYVTVDRETPMATAARSAGLGAGGGSPGAENRLWIKKTDAFDQRRAENPENPRPFWTPPKWRSHFVLAAWRTKSDTLPWAGE